MDNVALAEIINDPNGQPELLRLMLIRGNIDVPIAIAIADSQNTEMASLIYYATMWDKLDMVRVLIEAGADVNLGCTHKDMTPLMFAASKKLFDIAQLLLENDADPNIVDEENETALMYSLKPKHNIRMIRLLLNHSSPVNHVNNSGKTALIMVILEHHRDPVYCINLMKILIEKNADIDHKLLALAIGYRSIDIVRFILEQEEIDVNYQGNYGSALDVAIRFNRFDIIKLLLEAGADHTPLKQAINPRIVELYQNRQKDFILAKASKKCKQAQQKNASAQSILANEYISPPYVMPYPTLAQKIVDSFRSAQTKQMKKKKRAVAGHAVWSMNYDINESIRDVLDGQRKKAT